MPLEDTEGRCTCEDGGRDWSYTATTEKCLALPEAGEARKISSLEGRKEYSPPNTLISDFDLLNCEK